MELTDAQLERIRARFAEKHNVTELLAEQCLEWAQEQLDQDDEPYSAGDVEDLASNCHLLD